MLQESKRIPSHRRRQPDQNCQMRVEVRSLAAHHERVANVVVWTFGHAIVGNRGHVWTRTPDATPYFCPDGYPFPHGSPPPGPYNREHHPGGESIVSTAAGDWRLEGWEARQPARTAASGRISVGSAQTLAFPVWEGCIGRRARDANGGANLWDRDIEKITSLGKNLSSFSSAA